MVKASRYEREFISWASHFGLVARIAASGTLNTVVGDLILIPHKKYSDVFPRPLIIEVKATHSDVYYPSKHIRQISLLYELADYFNYDPYLAVKFIGRGWVIVPLSDGIPQRVTSDQAEPIPRDRKTIDVWLSESRQGGGDQ